MAKSKRQKASRSTGGPAASQPLNPPPSTRVLRSATRSQDPSQNPHLTPKARVLPSSSAQSQGPSQDSSQHPRLTSEDVDVEMSEPTAAKSSRDEEIPGDDVSGRIPVAELSLTSGRFSGVTFVLMGTASSSSANAARRRAKDASLGSPRFRPVS